MSEPAQTTVFAGVDGRTDTQLPDWYHRRHPVENPPSFATAIRELPQARHTEVAYRNPHSGEWVETDRHTAIVEPSRLTQQAATSGDNDGGGRPDPLFHVPTDSYAIINPADAFGPLEDVLREQTVEDTPLGEVLFGEIRQYRGGGEVHMDLLFDGLSVDLPERSDPITMGLTAGYDFFGGHALYVEGFARDTVCANSIRQLTDRETVRHVGDVEDLGEWWRSILEQVGLVADDLAAFITDAEDITVDFTDVPFTATEFYELLDLPEYLAQRAADDAQASAVDPFDLDMWTLHSGATYALTHHYRGKEGSSLDEYVRTANDILFNPAATIDRVEQTYEQHAEAATDADGQTGLKSQVALASIEQIKQDVREKAQQFEQREETLRERFSDS